jgi:hypothetical protein
VTVTDRRCVTHVLVNAKRRWHCQMLHMQVISCFAHKLQPPACSDWRQLVLLQILRVVKLAKMARPTVTQHSDDSVARAQSSCCFDCSHTVDGC